MTSSSCRSRHGFPFRHHAEAIELVSDDALGKATLLSQKPLQRSLCSRCIAMDLDDFVEDIAMLIDDEPEPVLFAIDGAGAFIEIPLAKS